MLPIHESLWPTSTSSTRLVVVSGDEPASLAACWQQSAGLWCSPRWFPLPRGKRWPRILQFHSEMGFPEFSGAPDESVTACSQSGDIPLDRRQVAATPGVVAWDRSWVVSGFRSSEMKAVLGCCSAASVWVNIVDLFEKSFRREQYYSPKNCMSELIPRFIHDTSKNYCYFKLVWTWKLFTAYFLCPPGWNLGTFWLDSSKYLIVCLTLNTCLHPIWGKAKPVLKCFAGANIPHVQDPTSCRTEP